VWISCSTGTDFAQKCSRGDPNPSATMFFRRMLANAVTCKLHLEVFIKWKLHCDVSEAEKGRCQARVEDTNTLSSVHLSGGIKGRRIMPWRS
jgi:hypothetical protein